MSPFKDIPIITDNEVSGEEKLRRVARLVKELRTDLKEVIFLPHERNAAMEQLKVFGRNSANADPIFTREGIEILTQHSFHTTSPTTSKAALQCLANALLSVASARQIFVDLGYSPKAVARLKSPKGDDELLMSRILFLTSYGTSQSFASLIDRHQLADHINENIARHARRHTKICSKKPPNPADDQALSETLKLLFNIMHFFPKRASSFHKSAPAIFKIISHRPSATPPLQPPLNYLINALLNFPMDEPAAAKKLLPSKSDLKPAVTLLISTLDASLHSYSENDLESNLLPLLTLLKRLFPASPSDIQYFLRSSLVPPSSGLDSKKASLIFPIPLSLKLLQQLRSPTSTQLHDAISALLFEVSDHDAESLGANFGIGFTSGFLLSRNGQIPSSNPEYEDSVRSLNNREESLSGPGSPRGSGRNSVLTGGSSASIASPGGLSPPVWNDNRRGSTSTNPSPRASTQSRSFGHSSRTSGSSTTSSTPATGLGIGMIAQAPVNTEGSESPSDKIPEDYDIVLETRKAWKGGGVGFKRTGVTKYTEGETETAGADRRGSVGIRKREGTIDLASRIEKTLSEMTILVLDDHQ